MSKVFIIAVEGKANRKDETILKRMTETQLTFDDKFSKGWSAEMRQPEAELLAQRLRGAGLSKKYFMDVDKNFINLF